jgi:hypothetical protein
MKKIIAILIIAVFISINIGYALEDAVYPSLYAKYNKINLRVPLNTKRVNEVLKRKAWSVNEDSSWEEPSVSAVITDSDKGWVKKDFLDIRDLPVGTLIYLGDTGQSIGADGAGEGYPIRYLVRIEKKTIKLWFGNNMGCYVGPAESLGSILYLKGGPQFTPANIKARTDINFPYFKWKPGIGLLPLTNRAPNELIWSQRFPFFRVLYTGEQNKTSSNSAVLPAAIPRNLITTSFSL